jgi:hypothetical protein
VKDYFSKLPPEHQVELMKKAGQMFNTLMFLDQEIGQAEQIDFVWLVPIRSAIHVPDKHKTIAEIRRYT